VPGKIPGKKKNNNNSKFLPEKVLSVFLTYSRDEMKIKEH
jgi:hypothetical protein